MTATARCILLFLAVGFLSAAPAYAAAPTSVSCKGDTVTKSTSPTVVAASCLKLSAWKDTDLASGVCGVIAYNTREEYRALYADMCQTGGASATGTATFNPGSPTTIRNPLGASADLPHIFGRVIATFLGVVGSLSLLVFFYAGVTYMTAAGREESITKAKDTMKYAFIGMLLIVFAYVIVKFFFTSLAGA